MAYDGSIKIDTSIDGKGFQSGLKKIAGMAATGLTAAVAGAATALTALGGAAIKTGIDFESAFAGVKKTVDATPEQLDAIHDSLINMSKEIPQSASALSSIAEAAGQLGIKTENIIGFTEVMANMGVATNMSSEEAATALARLANITQMPQTEFGRLGSVIVALGNNLATTEGEITAMALRIAGAGHQVGMSEDQILSFAGALSSVGIEADAGGTAISTLMSKMSLAVAKGDKELSDFADVAGMTSDEFKQAFEKDAAGAIMTFIEGLSKASEEGGSAIKILDDIGLSDIRMRDAMLRAAGASGVFADALQIGSAAWEENTALAKEAGQRYETMESRLGLLKNSVEALGISFYEDMQAPMSDVVQNCISYVGQVSDAFERGGISAAVAEIGNVLADAAVHVTEAAPSMIEAAVNLLKSFIGGIKKNAPLLAESAVEIVSTLVKGIADIFPKEISRPIKKAMDAVSKSFKSGGLRNAINTFKKLLSNLAKAASTLARVALPLLTKAIDTIGKSSDVLIPILMGVAAGITAWKIAMQATDWINTASRAITALKEASAGSTVAITLSQTAYGLLSKQLTFATAAQTAFNTAAKLSPFAWAAVAVAALGAAYLGFKATLDASKVSCEETNAAVDTMASGFSSFVSGIDNAQSRLSDFNDTLFATSDEQMELQTNMQEVQEGITTVCRTAVAERGYLVDSEIQQLNEYFAKLNELQEQQMAMENARMQAVKMQAQYEIEHYQGALEGFQAMGAELIATAEEQKENQIAIAKEQCTQKLVLLQQEFEAGNGMTQEAYEEACNAAIEKRDALIQTANEEAAGITASVTNSYAQRSALGDAFVQAAAARNKAESDENDRYQRELALLHASTYENTEHYNGMIRDADQRHQQALASIHAGMTSDLSKEQLEQAGVLLAMAAETKASGGEIDDNTKEAVKNILDSWDDLPEESKGIMANTLDPMLETMGLKGEDLQNDSEEMGNGVIDRLREACGVNSPSWKTRQIMDYVMQGAENGLEGRRASLLSRAASIAQSVIETISKAFDVNSPSRVMRDIFGYVVEGAEQGLSANAKYLLHAADELSAKVSEHLAPDMALDFTARMRADMMAQHAATAAQFAFNREYGEISGWDSVTDALSDISGTLSALRRQGPKVLDINLQANIDSQKVYESVQRVGLERGVQITSGRFDYER